MKKLHYLDVICNTCPVTGWTLVNEPGWLVLDISNEVHIPWQTKEWNGLYYKVREGHGWKRTNALKEPEIEYRWRDNLQIIESFLNFGPDWKKNKNCFVIFFTLIIQKNEYSFSWFCLTYRKKWGIFAIYYNFML